MFILARACGNICNLSQNFKWLYFVTVGVICATAYGLFYEIMGETDTATEYVFLPTLHVCYLTVHFLQNQKSNQKWKIVAANIEIASVRCISPLKSSFFVAFRSWRASLCRPEARCITSSPRTPPMTKSAIVYIFYFYKFCKRFEPKLNYFSTIFIKNIHF